MYGCQINEDACIEACIEMIMRRTVVAVGERIGGAVRVARAGVVNKP